MSQFYKKAIIRIKLFLTTILQIFWKMSEEDKVLKEQKIQENNSNGKESTNEVAKQQQKDTSLSLNQVRNIMRQFVDQREWHQFHTPRNLLLALVGEVGEVAQIFQWKGEVKNGLPEFSQKQKTHVGQELADVLSYLIRLSDVCGVDLSQAFMDKVAKNKKKYPSDLVKGSSKKYSQYKWGSKQQKSKQAQEQKQK